MKISFLGILGLALIVACTAPLAPISQPTTAPSITATLPAPTTVPTRALATSTIAASAPTVRERILLRELPGIGRQPYALAALGDKIYAACSGTQNLAVIQNDRVVKFITLGKAPAALAADPAQKRLYVSNASDKSISLIINDQIALTQNVGEETRTLLFFENRLFAGSDLKGTILVLDPATLQIQTRITVPNAASIINLAGDPAHHRLYVAAYDKTIVLDSTSLRVLTTLPTKGSYYTLAAYPSSDSVLTAIYDSPTSTNYLTVFDPNSGAERGRVKIGGDPRDAAITSDGARVYIANSYPNTVSVIDPRNFTILATIQVGMRPYSLALDENARRLYVANYYGDSVTVVDTQNNQIAATIPLAIFPTALAANESAGRVYVANASSDSVFVIEGTRIVKEIGVGRHPVDLARDPQGNRLLVANGADATLTIIDEATLSIRTTQPITRVLTTVAVDNARTRILAGDVVLDANTLAPTGLFRVQGNTVGSSIVPDLTRVNPNNNRIYAMAWNGTPGSNSRTVVYSVDANTLQQRTMLSQYTSVSALTLDPDTNRVFVAGTHPLALNNELAVFDANDAKVFAMPLPGRIAGMEYNPKTRHLFISHLTSYSRSYGPTPAPAENLILVLDGNSFGEVARLTVNAHGKMTRLGNLIYVASRGDGSITLVEDVSVPMPPAPTPTFTSTPWPTLTPTLRTPTPRSTITPPVCAIPIASLASQRWNPVLALRIGCPLETEQPVKFAVQHLEGGTLYWREDEKRIYVLFGSDSTWMLFDDTWNSSMPEDSCSNVTVAADRIKPKRGFGKVWCDQSAVRAKIGVGIAPEFGAYSALAQRFARGQMFAGTEPYHVIVLYADGKWE